MSWPVERLRSVGSQLRTSASWELVVTVQPAGPLLEAAWHVVAGFHGRRSEQSEVAGVP